MQYSPFWSFFFVLAFLASSAKPPIAVADPPAKASSDFGLTEVFEAEVRKIGQISPDEFARRFDPKAKYLRKITSDPTTAKYWDLFASPPKTFMAKPPKRLKDSEYDFQDEPVDGDKVGDRPAIEPDVLLKKITPLFDFRLDPNEVAILKKKGFLVSPRMGSHSFTDAYYRLWIRDLPVFVTSDSMLHAWHRFYDRMLETLEQRYIEPEFKEMLKAMGEQIPAAQKEYGNGPLAAAVADADFFLAVARRLLDPKSPGSSVGQGERVDNAIEACRREKMERYNLFGREREIDFSQFKPRGRYGESLYLQNYFRAVMWLGRIDFRIAGGETAAQDQRELAGAIVLHDLLRRANMTERWQKIDRVLLQLVGKADSLNFSQLGVVLEESALNPAATTAVHLGDLRTRILASKIGEQHIRGEWFNVDPHDPRKFELPRTFAFMGQRLILDSWALSKLVYDDIAWTDPTTGVTEKVQRRVPSCLDVGFAVFGNDQLTPLLTQRMKNPAGRKFRDGLSYQHNLAAVRNVIDRLPDSAFKNSVYGDWLGCLRELSHPTTDAKYPEPMRTPEWALKSTATQMASWTQLRYDNVLYAKPSYSVSDGCEYPAGFVEPVPHFWRRFEAMVKRTQSVVADLKFKDHFDQFDEKGRKRDAYGLDRFADAAAMLLAISEKELAETPLTKEEQKFVAEIVVRGHGSGAPPVSGWYPQLFNHRHQQKYLDDAHKWVALTTDIHTNPANPFVGDPGCVLHQGVGNVDLMIIAVDNGKDRALYAGPVFSHYEYETPNGVRHTNADWHKLLRSGQHPPRPEWTAGFVAPGVNPAAKNYGKPEDRQSE